MADCCAESLSADRMTGRIGYELPESGNYRSGFAFVDAGSSLLSLVGDFDGIYTFDLISRNKKRRLFSDHGCCVYSSNIGTAIGSAA